MFTAELMKYDLRLNFFSNNSVDLHVRKIWPARGHDSELLNHLV